MTEVGKQAPVPTAEKPIYYHATCMGYHHEGNGVSRKEEVPEDIAQKLVRNALAQSHYLPADKEHSPTIALFYIWGVHSKLDYSDDEGFAKFRDVSNRNLLSRAQLVGGEKFARSFAKAYEERAHWGANGPIGMDPLYLFSIRNDVNRSLVEQVLDDCYYVVVSAYDAAALVRGERKLLWRTKMSTPAQGVSLGETTQVLVASGGPFFGRAMNEPSIVDKRIDRKGRVGLGELKVIGTEPKPTEKSDERTPAK